MNKHFRYILLFAFNGFILFVLIFIQFLSFAFTMAMDPSIPKIKQRATAMDYVFRTVVPISIAIAVGLTIAFAINRNLFKLSFKKNILIVLGELIVVIASLMLFGLTYVNKFG
jgi:hypothetical protein